MPIKKWLVSVSTHAMANINEAMSYSKRLLPPKLLLIRFTVVNNMELCAVEVCNFVHVVLAITYYGTVCIPVEIFANHSHKFIQTQHVNTALSMYTSHTTRE